MHRSPRKTRGFTLVEVSVVLVVVLIVAAFAVPKYLSSAERTKASEARDYLATIQAAQERYHERHGTYAASLADLEVAIPAVEHFETTGIGASDPTTLRTTWSQTLVRKGPSDGYGPYTVVFTENGFDAENSTIMEHPDISRVLASGSDSE